MNRSQSAKSLSSETGAVFVESAVSLGAFLFGLILAFDVLRVSYLQLALEHAVQMTANWASLGETAAGATRVETIKRELVRRAQRLGLTIGSENIWVCPAGASRYCDTQDAGAPRETFQITAILPAEILLLHRQINLEFDAQGRNEPTI